jgi:hypothetical protein
MLRKFISTTKLNSDSTPPIKWQHISLAYASLRQGYTTSKTSLRRAVLVQRSAIKRTKILSRNKSRTIVLAIASGLVVVSLSGCAKTNLKTPCPDFGKWCTKTPINSWTYQGD